MRPTLRSALVVLDLENDAQVLIQASAVAHLGDQQNRVIVELQGERGTLEADHVFLGRDAGVILRGIRDKETEFTHLMIPDEFLSDIQAGVMMDPYLKQPAGPRLFVDAILANTPVRPNFHDGSKVQEVLDAALRSHATRQWVAINT